jgi:hypothetical protein
VHSGQARRAQRVQKRPTCYRLDAKPAQRHDPTFSHLRRSQRGGELGQRQPVPAEGGSSRLSGPARKLIDRIEVRSDDQHLLRGRARLKPSAGTGNTMMTGGRDDDLRAHAEGLRLGR